VSDPRIHAIVLMAPAIGYVFDKEALAKVQIPVRIYRPAADELLPHPWHAERIAQNLRVAPEYRVIDKAGHFVFMTPCSTAFATMAAVICTDPAGVDRRAIHAELEVELVEFFRRTLSTKP
jgi:predicted dienelactone hydrolase